MDKPNCAALLLAAGEGRRAQLPYNKVLHNFGQITALESCLSSITSAGIDNVLIASSEASFDAVVELAAPYGAQVYLGGASRAQSVLNGLNLLKSAAPKVVLIHDAARPFAPVDLFRRAIDEAEQKGSAVAAIKATSTIYNAQTGQFEPRNHLYEIQTPQAFNFELLCRAYNDEDNIDSFTDDSSLFVKAGNALNLICGIDQNFKITTPTHALNSLGGNLSIGIGFDVHTLKENRRFILGGISIPYRLGFLGHSDADVLTHAIMDSILSAAGFGDIGSHFPDTDMAYKGADSMELLSKVLKMIYDKSLKIKSLSAVIICQKPKLAPYLDEIIGNLERVLGVRVALGATTTENMGIIGQGEAVAVSAVCLLKRQ